MNENKYRIFVVCFGVILLLLGTYIGFSVGGNSVKKEENANIEIEKKEDKTEDIPTIAKKTDIEVTYEDYYEGCKETVTTSNMIYGADIEEVKKENEEYEVKEESDNKIIFYKTNATNCHNHFELKLVDNFVVIYTVVNDNVSTIYKNTEISGDRVREEILVELKKGIKVNSIEDLNTIIEDIES